MFPARQLAFTSSAATGAVRTYEATLDVIAPRVTLKLGTQVLPMLSANQFYLSSGSCVLLGPKSPPPVSALPGVRWNYVMLVQAAVAFCRAVRGERAVFDNRWTPRMGVFWARFKRVCVRGSLEKSPLLLLCGLRQVMFVCARP